MSILTASVPYHDLCRKSENLLVARENRHMISSFPMSILGDVTRCVKLRLFHKAVIHVGFQAYCDCDIRQNAYKAKIAASRTVRHMCDGMRYNDVSKRKRLCDEQQRHGAVTVR